MGRVDVALEEYKQLRAEILAHTQAQTTVVSIALTATAAIAGVAFGTGATGNAERLEILLALPLILVGLGLTYLAHSVNSMAIGQYIGQRLWPALANAKPDEESKAGGATVVHSWPGNNTVRAGGGDDVVNGGPGNDGLQGSLVTIGWPAMRATTRWMARQVMTCSPAGLAATTLPAGTDATPQTAARAPTPWAVGRAATALRAGWMPTGSAEKPATT